MKTMVSLMIFILIIGGLILSAHAADRTNFAGTYKGTQQGTVADGPRSITRNMLLAVSEQLELVATFYAPDTGNRDIGVVFDIKPIGDVLTFKMRYKSGNVAEYKLTLSGDVLQGPAYNIHTQKTSTINLTRMGIMACPLDQQAEKIIAPC